MDSCFFEQAHISLLFCFQSEMKPKNVLYVCIYTHITKMYYIFKTDSVPEKPSLSLGPRTQNDRIIMLKWSTNWNQIKNGQFSTALSSSPLISYYQAYIDMITTFKRVLENVTVLSLPGKLTTCKKHKDSLASSRDPAIGPCSMTNEFNLHLLQFLQFTLTLAARIDVQGPRSKSFGVTQNYMLHNGTR
jgi:hypothetical protein